ncbi:hypothetical protein IW140_004311 [Coemansia sp. RSA 1813]|nr:hypothetical protein IW138_004560 [Coemansia sp. RSA 986]KAJ2567801.1 hypothetical protein IW140_004311 [Coemansia sp. RSA 1813]
MDFDARTFTLPECHSVPRSKFESSKGAIANPVFKNVGGWDHAHSLSEFTRLSSTFTRQEVPHDRRLLGRIFYRNWNQHKNSTYFRRLYELRRALRILEQVKLHELVEYIAQAFYIPGTAKSGRKVSGWAALPCQHCMTAFAGRIAHVARLVSKIQAICCNVYIHFTAQVAQTLFMPLSLVIQGISSRLHMVLGIWHQDLIALYTALLRWLPSLPACPDSLSDNRTKMIAAKLLHVDSLTLEQPLDGDSRRAAAVLEKMRKDASRELIDNDGDYAIMEIEPAMEKKNKKRARQRVLDIYGDGL